MSNQKPLYVSELTDKEALRVARLLKNYFGWLGTDREANGGDVVDELCELYNALPQIDLLPFDDLKQSPDKDCCIYCTQKIGQTDIPPIDDDLAWDAIAEHHAITCEWVATRAHRIDE